MKEAVLRRKSRRGIYAIYAACIGTLFALFSSVFSLWQQDIALSVGSILWAHNTQALLWVIDALLLSFSIILLWIAGKIEKLQMQRQNDHFLLEEIDRRDTDLALLVHHRTAHIDRRLRMVEHETNQKMGFLANINHKIRTPMNGVIGMLGLLDNTELSDLQKEYMLTANNSVATLAEIINDIVDYSKIESGQLGFNEIDFTLPLLLEDIVDIHSNMAQDKGLQFNVSICEELYSKVHADSTRLRQLLNIIIGNAIKYTPKGEITFNVSQQLQDDQNIELTFTIRDTGIGIGQEQLGDLFLVGGQQTESDQSLEPVAGFELSIASELVNMFGGSISAESTLTQGSTFRFSIVVKKVKQTNTNISVKEALHQRRILVISNNQTVIDNLTATLRRFESDVTQVLPEEWHRLLEEFAESPQPQDWYDIVIIEQISVAGSYKEIVNNIGSVTQAVQVQFLLLAPPGQRGEAQVAAKAGVNAYLSMPFSTEQLVEILAKLLAEPDRNQLITKHTLEEDDFKPNRVLVVEDSLANQFAAKAILLKLGMTVDVVDNGSDAVNYSRQHQYKLILMDCQLSDMDGFEATRQIREIEQEQSTRPVPIVAMSNDVHQQQRQQGEDSGMDDFIIKPVTAELLDSTVKRWMKKVG